MQKSINFNITMLLKNNINIADIPEHNCDFIVDKSKCPYCGQLNGERREHKHCEKDAPLISVMIPSRVGEEIESMESLKRQTYKKIEIIVKYDEKKAGAATVRNQCVKEVKGDLFFFCDNDLFLSPNCLSDLYLALLDNPEADWAFGKFYIDGIIFNEGKNLVVPEDKHSVDWLNYYCGISTMSLIKRSVQPIFDETMLMYDDWDLWLTLDRAGAKAVFCDKVLFSTKSRANGISSFNKADCQKWKNRLYKKYNINVGNGLS